MQRKTNLFYTNGNDSKFITFSNYTESLTGNFLATDWKIYPDKFICMNVPSALADKEAFIKHLVARYENKMAFMRDYCVANNMNIEQNTYPLSDLMETIMDYDSEAQITFVGDVTEQDWNGVYSDTICTIDAMNKPYGWGLIEAENDTEDLYINCEETTYLYGWSRDGEYKGVSDYETVAPVFDDGTQYCRVPKYAEIKRNNETTGTSINFNIIIPLFVVMDINPTTNNDVIDETVLDLLNDDENIINVPLGIWFADANIELNRDSSRYAPSWSLVLSSQFKPYPYVDPKDYPTEVNSYTGVPAAYATFAQVLAQQNDLNTRFSNIELTLDSLAQRVEELTSKVNSIASVENVSNLVNKFSYLTNYVNAFIEQQEKETAYRLKWEDPNKI